MPKARDNFQFLIVNCYGIGRGAFRVRRMVWATYPGAHGKANVGMSNDKGREIRPRRKTKVSRAMRVIPGSVGS